MTGTIDNINVITDAHGQISVQYVVNAKDWYTASFNQDPNESKLHLSQNGGKSWNTKSIFDEGFIGELSFRDRNNGFLIFNNREVYKRTCPNTTVIQEYSTHNISPNPAKDVLHINANFDLQNYSIDIIDAVEKNKILSHCKTTKRCLRTCLGILSTFTY